VLAGGWIHEVLDTEDTPATAAAKNLS